MPIKLDVENMDGLDADDLNTLEAEYMETSLMYMMLSEFAGFKAAAVKLRLEGKTAEAVRREKICDDIYARLPKEGRW